MSSRRLIAADVRNELELLMGSLGGSVGDREGPLAATETAHPRALLERRYDSSRHMGFWRYRALDATFVHIRRGEKLAAEKCLRIAIEEHDKIESFWRDTLIATAERLGVPLRVEKASD